MITFSFSIIYIYIKAQFNYFRILPPSPSYYSSYPPVILLVLSYIIAPESGLERYYPRSVAVELGPEHSEHRKRGPKLPIVTKYLLFVRESKQHDIVTANRTEWHDGEGKWGGRGDSSCSSPAWPLLFSLLFIASTTHTQSSCFLLSAYQGAALSVHCSVGVLLASIL